MKWKDQIIVLKQKSNDCINIRDHGFSHFQTEEFLSIVDFIINYIRQNLCSFSCVKILLKVYMKQVLVVRIKLVVIIINAQEPQINLRWGKSDKYILFELFQLYDEIISFYAAMT